MHYHKYAAEFLGTFALTFVVWLSVAFAMPFPTPVVAALTLGLFVYTVGGISGAHLNPAVSIGVYSAGKLKTNDAVFYVVCQLAGAAVAMTVGQHLWAGIRFAMSITQPILVGAVFDHVAPRSTPTRISVPAGAR